MSAWLIVMNGSGKAGSDVCGLSAVIVLFVCVVGWVAAVLRRR